MNNNILVLDPPARFPYTLDTALIIVSIAMVIVVAATWRKQPVTGLVASTAMLGIASVIDAFGAIAPIVGSCVVVALWVTVIAVALRTFKHQSESNSMVL